MRKRIVVDASTVTQGGAVQVAFSYIIQSFNCLRFDYYYILSNVLFEQLKSNDVLDNLSEKFIIVDNSPAKSRRVKKEIIDFVCLIDPKVVFTVFGPNFIKFNFLHISGFANGWVSHASLVDFIKVFRKPNLVLVKLLKYLVIGLAIRKNDYIVFETNYAMNKFCERYFFSKKKGLVVSNTYPTSLKVDKHTPLLKNHDDIFSVLCLSSYYVHKNLESIFFVVDRLLKSGYFNFRFILTLDKVAYQDLKNKIDEDVIYRTSKYIINKGVIPVNELNEIYDSSSMVYLPSMLETYSAVCAESVVKRKILLLNDTYFFRDLCGDAALYVDSNDYSLVACKLQDISSGNINFGKLEKAMDERLSQLKTPEQKFIEYTNLISKVIESETNTSEYQ